MRSREIVFVKFMSPKGVAKSEFAIFANKSQILSKKFPIKFFTWRFSDNFAAKLLAYLMVHMLAWNIPFNVHVIFSLKVIHHPTPSNSPTWRDFRQLQELAKISWSVIGNRLWAIHQAKDEARMLPLSLLKGGSKTRFCSFANKAGRHSQTNSATKFLFDLAFTKVSANTPCIRW